MGRNVKVIPDPPTDDDLALVASLSDKVKHLISKVWDEALHPRGKDGKFIHKGGFVKGEFKFKDPKGYSFFEKRTAKVIGWDTKLGRVFVEDKYGRKGVGWINSVVQGVDRKAELPHIDDPDLPGDSGVVRTPKPPKPPKPKLTPEQRFNQLVERMQSQASELTDDPKQRMGVLDKIMGGLVGSPLTSVYRYNKRGASRDEWDDARRAQHEELWDTFISKIEAAGIPKEKRAVILGGNPGAGKSFSLKPGEAAASLGVVGWDLDGDPPDGVTHVVVNPDVIKDMMVDAGMIPDYVPGEIRPREAVSIIHAESNFLSKLFMSRLATTGTNVAYDSTMANVPHVQKNIRPLAENGYSFSGLYVHIPKEESRLSAKKRFLEESAANPELGGRFVPSEASGAWNTEGTFRNFESWFTDGWMMVDNTGVTKGTPRKEVYDEGIGDGSGLDRFLNPPPPPPKPKPKPKVDRPKTLEELIERQNAERDDLLKKHALMHGGVLPLDGYPQSIDKRHQKERADWVAQEAIAKAKKDSKDGKPATPDKDQMARIPSLSQRTDTAAASKLFTEDITPDTVLFMLQNDMLDVSPEVGESPDEYLGAPTLLHEVHRAGRGGLSEDVSIEVARLRTEGRVHDPLPVDMPSGKSMSETPAKPLGKSIKDMTPDEVVDLFKKLPKEHQDTILDEIRKLLNDEDAAPKPGKPDTPAAPKPAPTAPKKSGQLDVVDSVIWHDTKGEKELKEVLEDIGKIHAGPTRKVTATSNSFATKKLGGFYSPMGKLMTRPRRPSSKKYPYGTPERAQAMAEYNDRVKAYNAAKLEPVIKIMLGTKSDLDAHLTFAHEYGHHLDFDGTPFSKMTKAARELVPYTKQLQGMTLAEVAEFDMPGVSPAARFLAVMRATDAYKATYTGDYEYGRYLRNPVELWARAYAQYIAKRTKSKRMLSTLNHPKQTSNGFAWTKQEFNSVVAPLVEGVLQSWGLMGGVGQAGETVAEGASAPAAAAP